MIPFCMRTGRPDLGKTKGKPGGFPFLKIFGWCLCLMWLPALGCSGTAKSGLPNLRQEAVKLNDEGYQYYRESRWRLARNKFAEALKLNRLIDHRPGMAANLNNLGVLAQEEGNLKEATGYFRETLALQREIGNPAGVCEALNNLGAVLAAQGHWNEAQILYEEALDYARNLPPGPLLALTLMHQGDVSRHQKNYQQALHLYQNALAVDLAGKDRAGQAVRWARLGRTYLEVGHYSEARRHLDMALEEARRQELTGCIIDALDGLFHLALAQGNPGEARLYGGRLLELYRARGQEREGAKVEELLKTRTLSP
uniref:Tetratricopeptide repeat protein n=1 Tax=Desulfobacca acetoxidans TaxID=60893 RepID=A0A7C5AK93_9BACT